MSSTSVRAAYVVLSHGDWAPVVRLTDAIRASSEHSYVLVYHDSRETNDRRPPSSERVKFVAHGLATDWGSWELVEATLRALREARSWVDPDMVAVVSGADYPVRQLMDWESEVMKAPSWVGTSKALVYRQRWGHPPEGDDRLTRYDYLWFQTPVALLLARSGHKRLRGWRRARTLRRRVLSRTAPLINGRVVGRGRGRYYGVRRWPSPFSIEHPCYYGSQWFAVRRRELDPLLDQDLAPSSPLVKVYRRSIIPDESAIVTPLTWRSRPSSLPPVSMTLPAKADPEDVRVLTMDDLGEILGSGAPFARKVDCTMSADLLDHLDARTRR